MTGSGVQPPVEMVAWADIENEFAGDGGAANGGSLVLGNGFSTNIWSAFGYPSLLQRSGLVGRALSLFRGRSNFETVLAELSTALQVLEVTAPGARSLHKDLEDLAAEVRESLIETVGAVHPDAQRLTAKVMRPRRLIRLGKEVLPELAGYMPRYANIFVTNYDLISYWAAVKGGIADLFPGSAPFDVNQAEYWRETNASPKIFFLHGALHLYRSLSTNAEGKQIAGTSTRLLDVIRTSVNNPDLVPLFISEGTSAQKMARIRTSQYLAFCDRALGDDDAQLTVLGQALGDVDQHIIHAIERHPRRKVAVGVWVGDVDEKHRNRELKIRATVIRGRIAKCRDVVFFDSAEHPLTAPTLRCR